MDDLFDVDGQGAVILRLHVQPGAGRSAVAGRHGTSLKVRVGAPPVEGRANEACLDLVSELLGVKRDQVSLVGGERSRAKRVKVEGADVDEVRRLLGLALGDASRGSGEQPNRPRRW